MEKTTIVILFSVVKFLIGIVGLVITIVLLFNATRKRDNVTLKRAALTFFGMILAVIVLTVIEFLFLMNYPRL